MSDHPPIPIHTFSSLNDLDTEYDDEEDNEASAVDELEEEIDDPFLRMTSSGRRLSANMSFRFSGNQSSMKITKQPSLSESSASPRGLDRIESLEDTGILSDEEEELPTRGRSATIQADRLREQKVHVAPKVAMMAVMENIQAGDFISRLEAQENRNVSECAPKTSSFISFTTTVAKTFGRSTRRLDVDLEGRVVAQYHGKEKKVVHCHKFVSLAPTDSNPLDVACVVKDENGVQNKSWRFGDADSALRFCNIVAMVNTSGTQLLEVFTQMDRNKKGFLNVLDLAYALKSIGQPVEEKEVRTMMMLANTVATVQSKSASSHGGGWNPPGAKGGSQMGLSVDFTTFFELFAHSGQPMLSLEDCVLEWQSKFKTLNSSDKTVTASTAVSQFESQIGFPALLGGEEVVSVETKKDSFQEFSGLRYNVGGPNAMPALAGKMRLTNYRIMLKALKGGRGARHRMPEAFEELHIPYGSIAKIEEQNTAAAHIVIWCKDLRIVCIAFNPKQPQLVPKIIKAIGSRAFTGGAKKDIAFMYKFDLKYNPSLVPNGWSIYDPQAEFERQGALKGQNGNQPLFFMIDNTAFKHSPTYPAKFVVPLHLTKNEFKDAAKFRSKKRLPALTWRCPATNACLTRSAQPMAGFTGSRSAADERLLDLYRTHGHPDMPPDQSQLQALYLLDCRAMIAATGNSLQGKGTENAKNYTNASLYYCNIGNIHTMRNSLSALTELIVPSAAVGKARQLIESRFLSNLEETKWLEHVRLCLEASVMTAEKLHLEGASVLVHCSDGWDRTAQVCATAQLLLDPFFRTIRGLAVLVEKEWCAFGHKFGQRCGHFKNKEGQERSPIFLQWLDMLHQIIKQFPDVFQFDDRLLVFLADHAFSGLFGTFIGDCERERTNDFEAREKTVSIWTYVMSQADQFVNKRYKADAQPLWPSTSMKKLQLWSRYYSRWDPEVHPRYDKDSELSWHDDFGTNENHWRTTKKVPSNPPVTARPQRTSVGRMSMTSKPPPPPLSALPNRHSFSVGLAQTPHLPPSTGAPPVPLTTAVEELESPKTPHSPVPPPPFQPPRSPAPPPPFQPPPPPPPSNSPPPPPSNSPPPPPSESTKAPLVRTASSLFGQVTEPENTPSDL